MTPHKAPPQLDSLKGQHPQLMGMNNGSHNNGYNVPPPGVYTTKHAVSTKHGRGNSVDALNNSGLDIHQRKHAHLVGKGKHGNHRE